MISPAELNRAHWDNATDIHARGNVYGIENFKAGECRLHRVEVEELGDVRGKSLLHLQCHFGLDTLSWARRGARVTGIDFSSKGIALATKLAREAGIDARFIETDLYKLPERLNEQFDIVFTSYGVLCWLADIKRWGEIVARYLKPGGTFYIVEAHPFARVFPLDEDIKDGSTELRPYFNYFHDPAGMHWDANFDYADPTAMQSVGEHCWQHTMSDVVNALLHAGLQIEFVHEFPYCPWKVTAFCDVVERFSSSHAYYGLPERFPRLPLMFSIRAHKAVSTTD